MQFKRAERQNRESLSKTEIKLFLSKIKDAKYDEIRQDVYLLYYFGFSNNFRGPFFMSEMRNILK